MKTIYISFFLFSATFLNAQDSSSIGPASTQTITQFTENKSEDDFQKGPWEISSIEVKGNINLKEKLIKKTVRARKGKIYFEEDKKNDIESLMNLGSINSAAVKIVKSDSKVSEKNEENQSVKAAAIAIYEISEKPMIKEVRFSGNKEISKGSLKSELTMVEKDFFDDLKLREDLIKISDKYKEKGYIDASVDYEVNIDTMSNKCVLTYKIYEGKKAKIKEVQINTSAFKAKKIIKLMKNRPKKIYQPSEIEKDLKEVEKFYKEHGYNDFKIVESSVSFSKDRSEVFFKIEIDEGKKYKFGSTTFTGNSIYNSRELQELIEYRAGKTYNEGKVTDTLRNIQEKYADKGYLKASIEPIKSTSNSDVLDINFSITENSPVYVEHIDVEGNKATKTHVLRREIVQKEGEVFSLSKIRRSQEKIFNLGFIDDVNFVINPTPDPDKVDLVFDVTEGKPGMLTAGAGVSSVEGLVGTLAVSHMNMFGLANRLSLNWNFGKRVQDYSLSWTIPWVANKPTSLGFDLYNTRRYRPYADTYSAYTEKRTGGRITVAPRFEDDKYRLSMSYAYERIRISGVDEIYKDVLSEGTSVNSSVSLEFTRDTRDYIWDPTRGSKSSIGLEFSGGPLGGDMNFYKPTISHSYNKKLFSIDDYPFVLSFASRAGYVARFGKTDSVPVYERYFLGGADTIRGYNSNGQIGPEDGGKVYGIANVEFKFPLAREKKRTIVQWAFFLDAGNSWDNFRDINLGIGSKVRQIKTGAGFGIRFTTPAFPIRLDWGYGFNHKSGEQLSDIYFTIGNLF